MKKTIRFSRLFLPCAVISALIIVSGAAGLAVRGVNFGIDFKPGLIEEIRIAPPAAEIVYSGSARTTVEISDDRLDVIISGAGAENETRSFPFSEYPAVADIAAGLNGIEGVSASVRTDGGEPSAGLFVNSAVSRQLSSAPLYLYARNADVSADDVRAALDGIPGIALKELGGGETAGFQIRMPAASDADSGDSLQKTAEESLAAKFGAEKIAVVKTDFIGAGFSKSLARKSVLLLCATIFLIWIYAAFRFHWDFALGSVVALLHDVLIMFTFIVWSQIEFSTTILAAILTIVGYSINATVVILDRIRHNLRAVKVTKFDELIDRSLSDTLSRSILTTCTTLFAVISLFVFVSGSIRDFSLALMVGLLSGCYSSIFIAGGVISLLRRNWRPEFGIHHSDRTEKGVINMSV